MSEQAYQLEKAQKKFFSNLMEQWETPDPDPKICKWFGCRHVLKLEEQLHGDYCCQHSGLSKEDEPWGLLDPVQFVKG